MHNSNHYVIRKMSAGEVESIAVKWAAEEGWNPGLYDSPCFFTADPGGFFAGVFNGEPVACISAVSYKKVFGFIGFYIVKPEFRGKGFGLKIWNAAMSYLAGKNIGLDGVVDQQPNYKKSGFNLAYRNIRYEGISRSVIEDFPDIVPLSSIPIDDLIKYDADLFPVSRPEFLECWIKQPESFAVAALKNNKLCGYSMIRKCKRGYKIGPLFADNSDIAEKLFLKMNSFVEPSSSIYLDTPEVNAAAVGMAIKYGMNKVFETARMYTGSEPEIDLNRVFGVTTFELG